VDSLVFTMNFLSLLTTWAVPATTTKCSLRW